MDLKGLTKTTSPIQFQREMTYSKYTPSTTSAITTVAHIRKKFLLLTLAVG